MEHPIDVETALAEYWSADDILQDIKLRFGRASEGDLPPFAVFTTINTPGGRRGGPERSTDTEYVHQRLNLRVYQVSEFQCGKLCKLILSRLRETSINEFLQMRVFSDGYPVEESDRLWTWDSSFDVLYARDRVAIA
jgi:hypothetical protein